MSKEKFPSWQHLLQPTIDALNALGGTGSIQEIEEKVIEQQDMSNEMVNRPFQGKYKGTHLSYQLAWARTGLKKFGVLENPSRGVWGIVPGKQNAEIDQKKILRLFQQGKPADKKLSKSNNKEEIGGYEMESDIGNSQWRETLIIMLTETLKPDAFERLTQRLLRACSFTNVEVTGRPGDGGIDGTAIAKINDFIGFSVVFQCKRYTDTPITSKEIQAFRGAMMTRADRGLFVTTSRFTRDAHKEATKEGAPPIDLIDGEMLMDKLKELKMGVSTEMIEKVTIDEDWYKKI